MKKKARRALIEKEETKWPSNKIANSSAAARLNLETLCSLFLQICCEAKKRKTGGQQASWLAPL